MATIAHTPGPWTVNGSTVFGPDDAHGHVVHVAVLAHGLKLEANGRLITTAPDLLDIAVRLVKWDKEFPVNCHNGYVGLKELDAIIAAGSVAIAKAMEAS